MHSSLRLAPAASSLRTRGRWMIYRDGHVLTRCTADVAVCLDVFAMSGGMSNAKKRTQEGA